jgi:hypothetical protein
MSSHFALAAVSAVLRRLLSLGLGDLGALGNVVVTALPPDRIQTGANESSQLNLYLHQVLPNTGWRNGSLPSHNASGERMTNPPLALDLHYLLSAYGADELFAEALLGYGMQVLHETPVLNRAFIRDTWTGGALTPVEEALAAAGLADQIEQIKVTPHYLNSEEVSKLWTAFQAQYRPSAWYQASVVLIEGTRPARSPLPVLRRGPDDRGPVAVTPPFAALTRAHPAQGEFLPAVRLGEELAILGEQLNDQGLLRVHHPRLQLTFELPPAAERTVTRLTLHIPGPDEDPTGVAGWACGFYTVLLVIQRPNLPAWTTNAVPFALAPTITVVRPADAAAPLAVAAGDEVTLTCVPRIRPTQEARTEVLLGMQPVAVDEIATPEDDLTQPTTLRFTVPALAAGEYVVRLRVDGVDSLPVLVTGTPPRLDFDPEQKVMIA